MRTGGEANNDPAIFAAYAGSEIWTAVHAAQFASMAIMLAGLLTLLSTLDGRAGTAGLAGRLGAASTTATLELCGAVLAVDGVALKQAVKAWVNAPDAEKAARFANAETMRWLEWGTRSYENFTLGLAVLFAVVIALDGPVLVLSWLRTGFRHCRWMRHRQRCASERSACDRATFHTSPHFVHLQ